MPDQPKTNEHHHDFSTQNQRAERRTVYVLVLTIITMVAELVAGSVYGSMALLADGWHMGTHVAAFVIALFAYQFARKNADNPAYTFGTGKVNVLAGFASAVALAVVALIMLVESIQRLLSPAEIHFNESILVALIGLAINLISALLLKDDHHHEHSERHGNAHQHDDTEHSADHSESPEESSAQEYHRTHAGGEHHHHDHNLKAAYIHVLADALTSVLAIAALLSGKYFNLHWLDPLMGIAGAIIITRWAYGLIQQTGPVLIDASIDQPIRKNVTEIIEADETCSVTDLHIWKVSADHYAAIIAIETSQPKSVQYYKHLLNNFKQLTHLTIEVNTGIK